MAEYTRNQVSPTTAVVIGVVCEAIAAFMILGSLGFLGPNSSRDSSDPRWLAVCLALLFAFAGASIIVNYAVARVDPNGNLPAGTPFGVRVVQYLLGLGIVSMMTAAFTWVAFGSGPRHFSGGVALPFIAWRGATGETGGRIAFGFGALVLWAVLIGIGVAGARRLMRERRP